MSTGYRGYTDAEIVTIEQWLKDGLSALGIATEFRAAHGRDVTRNAIISVVHRNKVLNKIGFARSRAGVPGAGRPKKGQQAEQARKAQRQGGSTPYRLPGRIHALAVTALDSGMAPVNFDYRGRSTYHPRRRAEPHSVGMRFIDCLFDRCRWPIDLSVDAPATSESLFCGALVEPSESYCTCHKERHVRSAEAA